MVLVPPDEPGAVVVSARLPLRLVTCRSQTCWPELSKRIMCMVLHGLEAPPHSGPVLAVAPAGEQQHAAVAVGLDVLQVDAGEAGGRADQVVGAVELAQVDLPSVPSHASQEPPAGVAAIAMGSGSVSPSWP